MGDIVLGVALFIAAAGLLSFPEESITAAKEGLFLCYHVIIPSLFPFFVLSALVVDLGLVRYLGRLLEPVMMPLFRVNGTCGSALALGFIGGYPVGAKTAIGLYRQGMCTKGEALRLLAFCNNSGPAFILGVVGAGVFSSSKVGVLLYITHGLASVVVGILFRWYPVDTTVEQQVVADSIPTKRVTTAFVDGVRESFLSTINICGFVVFFTVVIKLFIYSGILPLVARGMVWLLAPLGMTFTVATQILTGFVEISSGVWSLSGEGGGGGTLSLAAFMLGWAGVSVHCQVLSFLGDSGLSAKTYLLGKVLHSVISVVLISLLVQVVPLEVPVSAVLVSQVEVMASLSVGRSFAVATLFAWLVFFVFLSIAFVCTGKKTGKGGRTML